MNKIYDKLLLIGALLVLGAGAGYYFMHAGVTPEQTVAIDPPTGGAYQAVPVPDSSGTDASWPEAEEQSSGWVYDVFTPPKIYIDKNGDFTIVPIRDEIERPPFGLYLAKIEPELYRIQLEGYIEEDLSDSNKSLLLFYDVQAKESLRMRPGDVAEASDFKVLSFDVKRIVGNDGSITKTARATILDERSGEEVVLTHKEPLYVDRVEIVLRSEQDPSIEVRPQAVGEAFETPLGQYVLDAIDLDGESVTVTKQGDNDFEPETRVLTLQVPVAEPTTTEIESTTFESTEPSSGGAFDGIFQ